MQDAADSSVGAERKEKKRRKEKNVEKMKKADVQEKDVSGDQETEMHIEETIRLLPEEDRWEARQQKVHLVLKPDERPCCMQRRGKCARPHVGVSLQV